MREVLLIARQELSVNLRRPSFILMTLLIPALGLIGLVISAMFGGQVGQIVQSQFMPSQEAVGYVDLSGVAAAELPQFKARFEPFPSEAAARQALLAKQISSYFVLPADYMQTGKVTVYGTGGGFSTLMATDSRQLDSFLVAQLLNGKLDAAIEQRVLDPANVQPVTLDSQGQVSTKSPFSMLGDFVVPYLFAILFVITLFTTSGFLLQGVSEEKEGRIIEILLSSTTPTRLLAGKILGLGAVGLVQVGVWLGAGAALLAAAVSVFSMVGVIKLSATTIGLSLVYAMLGYLLFATLMAVAGSMGTTQRESQQIAGLFSFAAAIPWMVIGVIFSNPNAPIAVALSYFPLTAPVMMLIRLGFGPVPSEQIAISLTILVVSIVLSLWAGAKIFRVGLLMYGKRPSAADLTRAFRQA